MVKTVIVTLTGTIPDTALSVDATVTVNGVAYTGKVTGIVTHENQSQAPTPPPTSVTLTAYGLEAKPAT